MSNKPNAIYYLSLLLLFLTSCGSNNQSPENKDVKLKAMSDREFQSGYAPVNGLKMYYEVHGNGYPLVLIHGGGSTIETSFGKIIDSLAKTHKVIAVEMQAHGRTADINRPLSFENDADDIAGLLDFLKIAKANLFGFSNGASTALQFAIRHPEKTNKIIAASTFINKDGAQPGFWEGFKRASLNSLPDVYKQSFLRVNSDTAALHTMFNRDVARMQAFTDIDTDLISSIKTPVYFIIGDKDIVTPLHAAEVHRLLSNGRLTILPGSHGDYIGEIAMPYNRELVSATLQLINGFLHAAK